MDEEKVYEQLASLTEREREVLRMRCDGTDYKGIGKKLVIEVTTVKSHMYRIYRKLELDGLPPAQRPKLLWEVYCPALTEADLPVPPQEPDKPEPVPSEAKRMVDEDEYALAPWRPAEIIDVLPVPGQQGERGFRALGLLVIGVVFGAALVLAIQTLFVDQGSRDDLPIFPAEVSPTSQVLEREVTVVVTSPPEVQTVEVPLIVTATSPPATETPVPTATFLPSPTALPDTEPGSVLVSSETWTFQGVSVILDRHEVGGTFVNAIDFHWVMRNETDQTLNFTYDFVSGESMQVEDDLGDAYTWVGYANPGSGSKTLTPGEVWRWTETYRGTFADEQVTTVTATVNLSRIKGAQWQIPIYH